MCTGVYQTFSEQRVLLCSGFLHAHYIPPFLTPSHFFSSLKTYQTLAVSSKKSQALPGLHYVPIIAD